MKFTTEELVNFMDGLRLKQSGELYAQEIKRRLSEKQDATKRVTREEVKKAVNKCYVFDSLPGKPRLTTLGILNFVFKELGIEVEDE